MAPKLRIYLDSSVISHLFHEDAPESRAATLELVENTIGPGVYDAFVSGVVLRELRRTKDAPHREALLAVIPRYGLDILPEGVEEIDRLASVYVRAGVLPPGAWRMPCISPMLPFTKWTCL